ncbi:alpha/beta hydrolase [Kocuria palustris]|uniref:alpha/beta hydrolase n=1 Tax=Kocuria palustris TaxID=71999 RepID=UPI0011A95585|nr:alpha/beta hydrolase [Kocuria palustris]
MTASARPRRRARLAALAAVAALGLGACTGGEGPREADVPEGAAAGMDRYYGQQLDWGACEGSGGLSGLLGGDGDQECAELTVPVDYADPEGGTTTVALSRLASEGEAAEGALVVNPGGPGGSGVDLIAGAGGLFGEELRGAYDIVSFDPRGVSRSDGIECFADDAERDAWRSLPAFDPQQRSVDDLRGEYRDLGRDCAQRSGPVLEHMDTASVARDMDVLRAVLGQDRTDYLGFSYGTHIGAEYARQFPDRVGRFVLDAAVDPQVSNSDVSLAQAEGFENALRDFLEHCTADSPECFAEGSVEDGFEEVRRILARSADEEITGADGRRVTPVQVAEGIITPLYSTATYSTLDEALRKASDGDYAALQELSDANHGRRPDGSYHGNSTTSFTAVNCLDSTDESLTDEELAAQQEVLTERAPTFGPYLGYSEAACQGWPFGPAGRDEPAEYTGDAEILVVGGTEDPATPYAWSEALTEQLGSARLLTREGMGHVSYSSGNGCIVEAVDGFLVDGSLPEEGAVCRDPQL